VTSGRGTVLLDWQVASCYLKEGLYLKLHEVIKFKIEMVKDLRGKTRDLAKPIAGYMLEVQRSSKNSSQSIIPGGIHS
jgi:hypothetical protein